MLAPADTLREHGLNVTSQRVAILRAIGEHSHSTADKITDLVIESIGTISRQSVFDTLNTLVDKKLIRRIQPMGSPALYEDRVGDNHHHLICRDCGYVTDVDCAVGLRPCLEAADAQGFAIDEAEVVYWGLCTDCRSTDSNHQSTNNPRKKEMQ